MVLIGNNERLDMEGPLGKLYLDLELINSNMLFAK